jgi:hypothetical protein
VFPPDTLLRPQERPGEGQLIELSGPPSSGRTSIAYRCAAATAARGELVAWIDLPDALDPRYLQRTGMDLGSLLWVRPSDPRAALRAAELVLKAGFALVVIDLEGACARELAGLGPALWTRVARALRAERAQALLIAPERVAGVFATLALGLERRRAMFEHGLLEGIEARARVVRRRTGTAGDELDFQVFQRPHAR